MNLPAQIYSFFRSEDVVDKTLFHRYIAYPEGKSFRVVWVGSMSSSSSNSKIEIEDLSNVMKFDQDISGLLSGTIPYSQVENIGVH